MWSEGGNLTVVSQGNGNGNTDECSASWTGKCSISPLNTERRWAAIRGTSGLPYYDAKGFDDMVAEDTGDVYFLSPESLDGSTFGIKNQRNLYVYRDGEVQLVATLDPGTQIYRMQISRDGSHAAFISDSRLTAFDNEGVREMYTFDAESRAIRCASCPPDGAPPSADVEGSQGGPFMSDDGRTFFATGDDLVPRDRDGLIDVYEYVDGRPQLITSGVSARDFTGGSELFNFIILPVHTGLESVSRDGTDVYFSTYDTLVEEDQNGQFVKFYDARVGGGFAKDVAPSPCAAADECHGVDSSAPQAPAITSGTNLGAGGNVPAVKQQKKKKKRKSRRHHKRRRGHPVRRRAHG
jgi:hypothetical protein